MGEDFLLSRWDTLCSVLQTMVTRVILIANVCIFVSLRRRGIILELMYTLRASHFMYQNKTSTAVLVGVFA